MVSMEDTSHTTRNMKRHELCPLPMPCGEKMNLSQILSDRISWTNGNFWNMNRRGPLTNAHRHQPLCLYRGVCTVLDTGVLQLFGYIVLRVFLLFELSSSGNSSPIDGLVLLGRLSGDVLAAVLSSIFGLQTIDLLLGLRDILCSC